MSSVEIKIELDKNCEEKFGRDVFNRARRHVEKWHKRDHKILVSSLEVRGGIIGFSFLMSILGSESLKPISKIRKWALFLGVYNFISIFYPDRVKYKR